MPKDKTSSHNKIVEIAKKEFLEKGFENVSMRDIAKKVGMAQASLYRHFESKEAMFSALVEPFIDKIKTDSYKHEEIAYFNYNKSKSGKDMLTNNMVRMVKDLMINNYDDLRLLICCSHGTRYESFVDELIWSETKGTYKAFLYLKEHGTKVKEINEDELHVLITSYMSAVLEPIEHGWPIEKSLECLDKVEEFFIPSWRALMGL